MRGEGLIIFDIVDFYLTVVILCAKRRSPVQELIPFIRLCDNHNIITAVDRQACLRFCGGCAFEIDIRSSARHRIGDRMDRVLVIDKDSRVGGVLRYAGYRDLLIRVFIAVGIHPLLEHIRGVVHRLGIQNKGIIRAYPIGG